MCEWGHMGTEWSHHNSKCASSATVRQTDYNEGLMTASFAKSWHLHGRLVVRRRWNK